MTLIQRSSMVITYSVKTISFLGVKICVNFPETCKHRNSKSLTFNKRLSLESSILRSMNSSLYLYSEKFK